MLTHIRVTKNALFLFVNTSFFLFNYSHLSQLFFRCVVNHAKSKKQMNNTTLSQPEGFKKYFSTTHTVPTEMPILPVTTSLSQFESGKKNTLSCNTTVNESFLPRSSAFLFDESLCYSNPEPSNGNVEKISANLDNFDLEISGQPQDISTNHLDGFLLHQLTQNDMDILLSLSLVQETTTAGDNDTVLGPTIEPSFEYDQPSKEIHSNTNSETTGEESTDSDPILKNLFQQQDDSVYFDPIFLQNFSRAVIESQMYPESDMNSEKGQQHDKEKFILSCPSEKEPNDSSQGGHRLRVCLWANCGEVFINLQDLISHLSEVHMGKGKATYRCEWEGCPRIANPFTKRHKMYAHLRIHTGERPFVCPEPGKKPK